MTYISNVQRFLRDSFNRSNLKKKDFIEQSQIPAATFDSVINAAKRNINLKTLLKLANYFQKPLDEVVGREIITKNKEHLFLDISLETASINLRNFLKNKVQENSLNIYQLSKSCGLADITLQSFIREEPSKKILNTHSIISVADYFNVSLDEMIGRINAPLLDKNIAEKIDQKDLDIIKDIKTFLTENNLISNSAISSNKSAITNARQHYNKTPHK